jgi:hypothetical protein
VRAALGQAGGGCSVCAWASCSGLAGSAQDIHTHAASVCTGTIWSAHLMYTNGWL